MSDSMEDFWGPEQTQAVAQMASTDQSLLAEAKAIIYELVFRASVGQALDPPIQQRIKNWSEHVNQLVR